MNPTFVRKPGQIRLIIECHQSGEYSPDMEKVYVVEPSGELTPVRLLNKTDNAVVKRERVRLSEGGYPS